MTINEQTEAAWSRFANSDPPCYIHRDSFEAGYRAALRDLYREVEPSEMVVGRNYWAGGMIGEMQGFQTVRGEDGVTRQWPVVNGTPLCPVFVVHGPIPNGSDFPAELFGKDVNDE